MYTFKTISPDTKAVFLNGKKIGTFQRYAHENNTKEWQIKSDDDLLSHESQVDLEDLCWEQAKTLKSKII